MISIINLILRVIFRQIQFDYLKCQIVYYYVLTVVGAPERLLIYVFVRKNIRVKYGERSVRVCVCDALNPKFRSNY